MSTTTVTAIEQQIRLIKESIITIPNYPQSGVLFRDITGLLADHDAFSACVQLITAHYKNKGITKIVGTEARGFLFGTPIALMLGVGFIPVRKPNKLPRETISQSYQLEYGMDVLEIHRDALSSEDNVLVVDDLLATGGTVEATVKLIHRLGGHVHDAAFIIELPQLNGRQRLKQQEIDSYSVITFDGD